MGAAAHRELWVVSTPEAFSPLPPHPDSLIISIVHLDSVPLDAFRLSHPLLSPRRRQAAGSLFLREGKNPGGW